MNRLLWFVGFGALLLAALVVVPASGAWLPEMVATKFSVSGDAHGFTPRHSYLAVMLGLSVGLPLLLVAAAGLAATHATGLIEVPHRDHWFAPERRAESAAFLRLHMARLGCVFVLFFAALHGLTLQANLYSPARLPMSAAAVPLTLLALALVAWTIVLRRRFRDPG